MLHLVLGPPAAGKTAYINNQLRESVGKTSAGLISYCARAVQSRGRAGALRRM